MGSQNSRCAAAVLACKLLGSDASKGTSNRECSAAITALNTLARKNRVVNRRELNPKISRQTFEIVGQPHSWKFISRQIYNNEGTDWIKACIMQAFPNGTKYEDISSKILIGCWGGMLWNVDGRARDGETRERQYKFAHVTDFKASPKDLKIITSKDIKIPPETKFNGDHTGFTRVSYGQGEEITKDNVEKFFRGFGNAGMTAMSDLTQNGSIDEKGYKPNWIKEHPEMSNASKEYDYIVDIGTGSAKPQGGLKTKYGEEFHSQLVGLHKQGQQGEKALQEAICGQTSDMFLKFQLSQLNEGDEIEIKDSQCNEWKPLKLSEFKKCKTTDGSEVSYDGGVLKVPEKDAGKVIRIPGPKKSYKGKKAIFGCTGKWRTTGCTGNDQKIAKKIWKMFQSSLGEVFKAAGVRGKIIQIKGEDEARYGAKSFKNIPGFFEHLRTTQYEYFVSVESGDGSTQVTVIDLNPRAHKQARRSVMRRLANASV